MKGKSRSIFTLGCYLILACLLAPLCASAEEAPVVKEEEKSVPKLEETVVTATRIEEPRKDIPASVQVISSEDIKNSTAMDAGDLIAEASLGHVTKYNGFLTASVEIRGLQTDLFSPLESRVLVLINGSNAGTVNLSKIPRDDIETIEIVKGPASVLYGSSAMGGVINIITKEGKEEGIHGSVRAEGGSWDYWKGGAELSGKQKGFDYYLTVSRAGSNDYGVPGLGIYNNTAYQTEDASARLGYTLFGDHHISIGYQYWNGWNLGSPGATYALSPDSYSNKQRYTVDVNYKTKTLFAKYYYGQDIDESHSSPTMVGPGNSFIYRTDIDTQGARLENVFPIGDHRIIVGGQWDRIAIGDRSNTGVIYNPDSQYDSYGAFAEGRLSFFEKRLLASGGVRYDYFDNELLSTPGLPSTGPNSAHLDHFTERGGVVFKLTDALTLRGTGGTAFRAPAPLELAGNYTLYGYTTVGNPNLKPEQSTSFDVGVDYSKGPLKSGVAFYHTDFDNKIVSIFDQTRNVFSYQNVPGATIEGIEFNGSYDIGADMGLGIIIEPFTNITYKFQYRQKNEGQGDTNLTYTPRWTGAFGIRLGQQKWQAQLVTNYVGAEDVTDYNPNSVTFGQIITKGDFYVVNLKGFYRPIKNLELTASIMNLLNNYYEYVQDYPMPGITFIGGAKFLF